MPELENSSLNVAPTESTEAKPVEGQQGDPSVNTAVAPATNEPPKATDPNAWDYKTDPRWGKMWKTESDIIRSYHEADKVLETKYKPAYKQYEGLIKTLKENGVEAEKINEFISEYKTLKDPQNPTNALWSMLSPYFQNPEYVSQFDSVIENIRRAEMQRKYPGMTEEQIARQQEMESRLNKFEQMVKQQEEEKKFQESMEALKSSFKGIEDYAKSIGFELSDDIKRQLLEHCEQNNVPIKYMMHEFRSLFNDQVKTYEQQKIKAQILAEQEKQNKTHIKVAPSAPNDNPVVGQKKDTIAEGLRKAFKL